MSVFIDNLCEKSTIMKELSRVQLLSLDDILERGEVLRDPDMDFDSICDLLRIDPAVADSYLREATGCSGEDIVDRYRERLKI